MIVCAVSVFGSACVDFGSNVPSALCSVAAKTCIVHSNVCNALAYVMTSSMPYAGWTIYFSATTYTCSTQDILSCSNTTAVSAAPLKSGQVVYTFPIPSFVYSISGVTFAALPVGTPVTLAVPPISVARGGGCGLMILRANNISFVDISIDASACVSVYTSKTTALLLSEAANLSITNMNVYAAPVLVGMPYSGQFGTIRFSGYIYISGFSGIFSRSILVRVAVHSIGIIDLQYNRPYPILTASGAPALTIVPPDSATVWDVRAAFEDMALEPLDYVDATCTVDYNSTENPYLIAFITVCVLAVVLTVLIGLAYRGGLHFGRTDSDSTSKFD